MEVTNDLTKFGYRELDMAGDLLKAYAENGSNFLYNGVQVFFNASSGFVFLGDENGNTGVMEDGKLVQFFCCPECGNEGTQKEALENGLDFESHDGFCSEECKDKNI